MDGSERRRSFRLAVEGYALLWRDTALVGRYAIAELSMRGCLLHHGPAVAEGEVLSAVVHVDGHSPFSLPGTVVRSTSLPGLDGACLALQFDEAATLGPATDWMAAPGANDQFGCGRQALLVHPEPRPVEGVLRRLGHGVQVFNNALDALWAMEHAALSATLVLVCSRLPEGGRDLVRFIGIRHPDARCLLLSPDGRAPLQLGPGDPPYHSVQDHPDAVWNLLAPEVEQTRLARGLRAPRLPAVDRLSNVWA